MGYTLGEAARAAGISKASVGRAIKSGRLSASRRDDGTYSIEPSELFRVYPATGDADGPMRRSETGNGAGPLLTDVTAERDQYRVLAAEREETIRDLRRRLDDSEDERRRVQEHDRRALAGLDVVEPHAAGGAVRHGTPFRTTACGCRRLRVMASQRSKQSPPTVR